MLGGGGGVAGGGGGIPPSPRNKSIRSQGLAQIIIFPYTITINCIYTPVD